MSITTHCIVISDPTFPSGEQASPAYKDLKEVRGYRHLDGDRREVLKDILELRFNMLNSQAIQMEQYTQKYGGNLGVYDWNMEEAYGFGIQNDFKVRILFIA